MDERREFVMLATQQGANIRQVCRGFGISTKTGYKWLKRFKAEGEAGLEDRSRRPHQSPNRTPPELEAAVLEAHPCASRLGCAQAGRARRTGRLQPTQSQHHPGHSGTPRLSTGSTGGGRATLATLCG